MPATIALQPGPGAPGGALQQHHVVREHDRNPGLRRRTPVRAAFPDKINDPPTKLRSKRLARQPPPSITPDICDRHLPQTAGTTDQASWAR